MSLIPFWSSPLTAAMVAAESSRAGELVSDGSFLYWTCPKPQEKGRVSLIRSDGEEILSAPYSARTRVNEYGGGALFSTNKLLYFINDNDKSLYRRDSEGKIALLCTIPEGRFGDFTATPDGVFFFAVLERQEQCFLVRIDTRKPHAYKLIVSGHDFFAFPRVSPDGKRLAWIAWNHPNMPWDSSTLWTASLNPQGEISTPMSLAGSHQEAILQPHWSPTNVLYYLSDRTGFWNLYKEGGEAICPLSAEIGAPLWTLGDKRYTFFKDKIAAILTDKGIDRLILIDPAHKTYKPLPLPYTVFQQLITHGETLACFAAGPQDPYTVITYSQHKPHPLITPKIPLPKEDLSEPAAIVFPTEGGKAAYGFYYPPTNHAYTLSKDTLPPLIVKVHGGPTSHTTPQLRLDTLFFTTRGFAVVDVNFRGSTGYGRSFREQLRHHWGQVDVEDCVSAAKFLIQQGKADPHRLIIRGSSSGGYTVLCALAFTDVFSLGIASYGIADLEAFIHTTHKFERHYSDFLLGVYPERASFYRARSPIHAIDRMTAPLLLFQGTNDTVVPPAQSIRIAEALKAKQHPVELHLFEGEGHGFREGATKRAVLELELAFLATHLSKQPG